MTALEPEASLSGWLSRLAKYKYVAELVVGKRVLELQCGTGLAARFLAEAGADEVVGVDALADAIEQARTEHRLTNLEFRVEDPSALELEDAAFDAAFVPDGAQLLRRQPVMDELRRVIKPGGFLVFAASNADRPGAGGGASFFDLKERLEKSFPPVRMIAVAPFIGVSLVEYAGDGTASPEVELDTSLLELGDRNDDDVSDYIAVCGDVGADFAGQFTVMQVPAAEGIASAHQLLAGEQAESRRDQATARRLAKTLERVRELEAELLEKDSGGKAESELRGRLTAVMRERDELVRRIEALKRQVDDAQQETGRVAADAGFELNKERSEVTAMRMRVLELEAKMASEEAAELGAGQETQDVPALAGSRETQDMRSPVEPEAAAPNGASISELIAEAMELHAAQVKQLEEVIDERSAFADEQSDERSAAVAEVDKARAALAELGRRLSRREAELVEYRTRAAKAEGALLKHRGDG